MNQLLTSKKKQRVTCDMNEDEYLILKSFKEQTRISSIGSVIDYLTYLLIDNPATINKELADFFYQRKNYYTSLKSTFSKEAAEKYDNLLHVVTRGYTYIPEEVTNMKKVEIANGYAQVPEEWVYIPFSEDSSSNYVGIVEIENGERFNAPHFYFTSSNAISTLSKEEEEEIYGLCNKAWSAFSAIKEMGNTTKPIMVDGQIINNIEIKTCPRIVIFPLREYSESANDCFPYGVKIVRD